MDEYANIRFKSVCTIASKEPVSNVVIAIA